MTTKTAGDRDPSRFNSAIRQLYAGGSNNTGQVTLAANATSTVVTHQSCNPKSHISLTPITANASIALAPSVVYQPDNPRAYQFSRVLSVASGNVSYTGLGFKPALLFFYGGEAGSVPFFDIGSDDGARHQYEQVTAAAGGATVATTSQSFAYLAAETNANFQEFTVASMDSDGFTLTWTKNGSPTGTYLLTALAFPDYSASQSFSNTVTAGAYISARSIGSFTITHRANAAVDQTFTYSVTGGA